MLHELGEVEQGLKDLGRDGVGSKGCMMGERMNKREGQEGVRGCQSGG